MVLGIGFELGHLLGEAPAVKLPFAVWASFDVRCIVMGI